MFEYIGVILGIILTPARIAAGNSNTYHSVHATRAVGHLQSAPALSTIHCGILCEQLESCRSFSYNDANRVCRLSRNTLRVLHPGSKVFRSEVSCPDNFQDERGRCFKMVAQNRNWQDANEYCISLGGHLFTVRTAGDFNLLDRFLPEDEYWVDGRGRTTWDGSELIPTRWDPSDGHPADAPDGRCIVYDNDEDEMERENCNEERHFICQID